ncbi:MAG: class I SAM-dependent methyltransferase [Candidatus Azambacteria bacterium]|nr:class I SAM-dependent methyltransferase [Candidatus Azambacteria bacterium]
MTDNYKNDFEKFLAHTNEKEVLFDEIVKEIERCKTRSLLDIGAGDGRLSIPLSKKVTTYLAVEPKESFAEKLRAANIRTIQGTFPVEIPETFDFVLSSHSISYDKELYEAFLQKAWSLLNPEGTFLIITYRGQEDDWTNLMKNLGNNPIDYNRAGFNKIIELLHSLGEVKMKKVATSVRTENFEDMIQTLSFVASDGKPDKKNRFLQYRPRLEKILRSRYQDEAGYFFPFQHFFITTRSYK